MIFFVSSHLLVPNPAAQWGSHGGGGGGGVSREAECPYDSKIFVKKREKSGKRGKKSGKRGKIRKNRQKQKKKKRKEKEGSFTLPLLTDRAGYTSAAANMLSTMSKRLHTGNCQQYVGWLGHAYQARFNLSWRSQGYSWWKLDNYLNLSDIKTSSIILSLVKSYPII